MTDKVAILDTDFTIKAFYSQNAEKKPLIDIVLQLPYKFYCHEQNKIELTDNSCNASNWLQSNIDAGKVLCLTVFLGCKTKRNSYKGRRN